MGCFLTVTKDDFDQIKNMRGVHNSGKQGRDIRIEIGDKSWSKLSKTNLARRVRDVISKNQYDRNASPKKRAEQTTNNFRVKTQAVSGLDAISYKSFKGTMNYRLGKAGEDLTARILEEQYKIKVTEITKGPGPDIKGITGTGRNIVVEVKSTLFNESNKSFSKRLSKDAYGGKKQCSDPWLNACGINPKNVDDFLGVHIDIVNDSYSVYRRADGSADHWDPIAENIPLSSK